MNLPHPNELQSKTQKSVIIIFPYSSRTEFHKFTVLLNVLCLKNGNNTQKNSLHFCFIEFAKTIFPPYDLGCIKIRGFTSFAFMLENVA